MDFISRLKEKVYGKHFTVVFPEGRDERIIKAARIIKDEDIAQPIVLGTSQQLEEAVAKSGTNLDGIKTIDPKLSERTDYYAEKYTESREEVSVSVAKHIVSKPLSFAGMMVVCGDADTCIGGVASATATLIQAGTLTVGLLPGLNTVSSYFLMIIPDFQGEKNKPFIYADCAVNIDPTAEQLADIALASAESARRVLNCEPRVALLSFSTKGSASAPSVDKVKKALELARARQPELAMDGEFQADSAIVPRVAAKKVKEPSDVAGRANVLIFPDLNAGNMAYKLTQYMANAQAIGPFLQGFARPISDLSRGASVDEIVATTAITLAQIKK